MTKNIEAEKIIKPIPTSDGAGVKLKRSIGIEPNYFDPLDVPSNYRGLSR